MIQPNWTMERLVQLLSDIASAGWAVRTSMYGTHTGDFNEKPWRGPLACEVYVAGWRMPGPVSLSDLNALGEIVARHGAEMELSAFGEEGGSVAKVGVGEYGSRFLIENYIQG